MKKILSCLLIFPFALYAKTAILVSLDGVAADYVENEKYAAFETLKQDGIFARLIPPFPSLTFPSHTTMVTGCSPGEHGIVGNRFIDKKKGDFAYEEDPEWIECEPLWVTAER